MKKNEFIDASLVNIREKLPSSSQHNKGEDGVNQGDSPGKTSSTVGPASRTASAPSPATTTVIPDKEWKKALFARWDEYKSTRRDVMVRLKSRISRIPLDMGRLETALETSRVVEAKFKKLLDDLDALDDSEWNRSNFASELATALKKVENARLECVVLENTIAAQSAEHPSSASVSVGNGSAGFIHELFSISFLQAFKLGLGLFFTLTLAILFAAVLLAFFNYLTVN
ncbi:MAG: hypothetical protein GXP32_04625 [Kiritimatiellaeota bacterium]|nr:hypothetical protein [Kiritimatiellota bacterium]